MTREEAIIKINKLRYEYNDLYIDYCGVNEAVNMAIEALQAEPTRHAHWEESKEDGTLFCSHCGRPTYDSHDEWVEFNGRKVLALVYPYYCGYCGCKMDETDEVTE